MTPEVKAWLDLAENDYGVAQREFMLSTGPNIIAVCFHSQQCAEKLIKALLVQACIEPPRVHDLTHLVDLFKKVPFPPSIPQSDLDALEPGAVVWRYPGMLATVENATQSLQACTRIRALILPRLQGGA